MAKFKATKNHEQNLAQLDALRSDLLSQTDWALMEDSGLTAKEKAAVKKYRQALRDCLKTTPGKTAEIPYPEDFVDMPNKVVKHIHKKVHGPKEDKREAPLTQFRKAPPDLVLPSPLKLDKPNEE